MRTDSPMNLFSMMKEIFRGEGAFSLTASLVCQALPGIDALEVTVLITS